MVEGLWKKRSPRVMSGLRWYRPSRKDQMVDFCFEDSLEETDGFRHGFRLFSARNLRAKTDDLGRAYSQA